LPYFAGAGVFSTPAKLPQHLFVLQTYVRHRRKNLNFQLEIFCPSRSFLPELVPELGSILNIYFT
jgi:acyl-CoA thioesterase FadM